MTGPLAAALGVALGIAGAAWHLGVVRYRARQLALGHAARGWLTAPLGIAGPAGGFLVALLAGGGAAAAGFLVAALATSAFVLFRARSA